MADEQATPTENAPEASATETAAPPELGDAGKQALDRMKAERDEARRTAKAHEKALEQFRTASLTEAERAVVEAEQRGRVAAATEFGQRLARTEFIAEAARRNPGFDARSILDDLNLARYIGEDGEPDSKAIAKAAQRLIPEVNGTPQPPSFDGGTRQAAPSGASMNDLLRQAAGRA